MVERRKAADPGYPTLKRLRFVTGNRALGVGDTEWTIVQGIEFSEGRDIGESWTATKF
jgi:hypothetical protein